MSAASYNRGSRVISRQLDDSLPPAELQIMRDLSEVSALNDGIVPLGPTVVRLGPRAGEAAIMNKREGGWRSFAYSYSSIWQLAREWRLVFVGMGEDEHSRYFEVVPLPKDRS